MNIRISMKDDLRISQSYCCYIIRPCEDVITEHKKHTGVNYSSVASTSSTNTKVGVLVKMCVSLHQQNLYNSIRNEPFKIPEDDGNDLTHTFFNPEREGWLLKLGKTKPSSEETRCMRYYKDSTQRIHC